MLQVTDANFKEVLGAPLAIVEFWAEWCPGCKASMPTIERIAKELHGQVLVVGANIDNAPKATEKYEVATIPTLVLLKDGKEISKIDGTSPYRKLMPDLKAKLGL